MEKKILLFGFDVLPEILAAASAAKPFGAEVVPVGRGDYGRTLGVLTELDSNEPRTNTGGAPVGRMMVLCGLSEELESLLPAMTKAGVPPCPKAVLTDTNRSWTPIRLYGELRREREAMQRGSKQ